MWSWVLAAVGSLGLFFVGGKKIWGWGILILNECIWVAYALSTKQYGFIAYSIMYVAMYVRAILSWGKNE